MLGLRFISVHGEKRLFLAISRVRVRKGLTLTVPCNPSRVAGSGIQGLPVLMGLLLYTGFSHLLYLLVFYPFLWDGKGVVGCF